MIREEMHGKGIEVPETSFEAEENNDAEREEDGSSEKGNDGGSSSDNDCDEGDEASSGHERASSKVDVVN
jgi:hypothetical protein